MSVNGAGQEAKEKSERSAANTHAPGMATLDGSVHAFGFDAEDRKMKNGCEVCGKAPEIVGQPLCRACDNANYQEPDFERLLELRNDALAWARDGDEA